ncbi:MAG: hypothetical protein NPIRA03_23520 [Nitrospirales bacterium]|nr:MAG: hypothetical protein NPIRA03_23520 [Nitrospirales bacterium]
MLNDECLEGRRGVAFGCLELGGAQILRLASALSVADTLPVFPFFYSSSLLAEIDLIPCAAAATYRNECALFHQVL